MLSLYPKAYRIENNLLSAFEINTLHNIILETEPPATNIYRYCFQLTSNNNLIKTIMKRDLLA